MIENIFIEKCFIKYYYFNCINEVLGVKVEIKKIKILYYCKSKMKMIEYRLI